MSLNQLNKLKGSGGFKYQNPYVSGITKDIEEDTSDQTFGQKKAKKPPQKDVDNASQELGKMSILGQNNYVMSQIYALKREIESLRFDVVTLLTMIEDDGSNMTLRAVRSKYSKFRASDEHIMQRIVDRKEAIINNELKINDGEIDGEAEG